MLHHSSNKRSTLLHSQHGLPFAEAEQVVTEQLQTGRKCAHATADWQRQKHRTRGRKLPCSCHTRPAHQVIGRVPL